MLFGAHVSAAGGLLPALERAVAVDASVVQVHTQSPRVWRPSSYSAELLAEFASRLAACPELDSVVCHASYLVNLAAPDPELASRSLETLVKNLEIATGMGAFGVVLHPGSHRGEGLASVLGQLGRYLCQALDTASERLGRASCPILLENTAGAGGTIGRSLQEIVQVLDAASGDPRLGVCLDTQHLYASGVAYESLDEAAAVVSSLSDEIGLERLALLHLNDSKVPLGSNRDRHENLGEGRIGARALGSLLGHPRLQHVPAVLEVPGSARKGPGREDLAAARAIHASGLRRWQRATLPPPPAPRRGRGGRTGSRQGRSP